MKLHNPFQKNQPQQKTKAQKMRRRKTKVITGLTKKPNLPLHPTRMKRTSRPPQRMLLATSASAMTIMVVIMEMLGSAASRSDAMN